MPKIRTKKAAAKRFKITSKGKVLHRPAYKSHLLEWKTASRKRKLCKERGISKSDIQRVERMMPYGSS